MCIKFKSFKKHDSPALQVPLQSLSVDEAARVEALHSYFCEMFVDCNLVRDNWSINLSWPENPDFYIDPIIPENLKIWHPEARISQVPFTFMMESKYLEALNDNWSLYGWSKWLQNPKKKPFSKKITIIHLDDHEDLMSPKAYFHQGKLYDIFTKRLISVFNPQSIKSAILSGAIGIGEFIIPLLLECPCVEIIHLSQTMAMQANKKNSIILNKISDPLWPHYERISAHFCINEILLEGHTYRKSADIESLLDVDENSTIFLHIDLDYFNNRYNGCSNWQHKHRIHNPNFYEIEKSLFRFINFLEMTNLLKKIDNVTVGISPGFFPSEYWAGTLNIIRSCAKKIER